MDQVGGGRADPAEVARLRAEPGRADTRMADRRKRTRAVASSILVVLASISVVLATLGVWLHDTLFETDSFMETVTPVLSEEVVTDALGRYLTAQTFEALAVRDRVENTLGGVDDFLEAQLLGLLDLGPRIEDRLAEIDRPRFADLADPIVTAAQNSIEEAVQEYLASEEFQRTFEATASRAHATSVALLRADYDELPALVVDDQFVRIDLTPAVVGVIQRAIDADVGFFGLDPPPATLVPVETPDEARTWLAEVLRFDPPPDFAQVTVMSSARLGELQGAVRWLDRLVWFLVGLVVALIAAAISISNRRLRTVIQLGVGAALASLLSWLVVQRLEQVVVEAFGDSDGREIARVMIGHTISSLKSLGVIVVAVSLLVVVVSLAFSRNWHRRAAAWISTIQDSRRFDRFLVHHIDALRIAGAVGALLVLWLTGVGLWSVLVVAAATSCYLLVIGMLRSRALGAIVDERVDQPL